MNEPTSFDLARDLEADLVRAESATIEALGEWGEADDVDYILVAREGWPAAIRRALAAEGRIDGLEAEVDRLRKEGTT